MTSSEEFRVFGKAMIDYVADYLENIRDRSVVPDVKPGYLRPLVPAEAPEVSSLTHCIATDLERVSDHTWAPEDPDQWKDVMADLERVVMPGVTHWHHPKFFAYFPTANSYPAIVADILSDAIACIGFSWIASPACTELETVMMDWLAKMINLPQEFLFEGVCADGSKSKGGGVITGTASEATLTALLTARSQAVTAFREQHKGADIDRQQIIAKLVAYGSNVAHSSVERAGMLGGVKMRLLEPDSDYSLRGETLERAMAEDRAKGLIPFCVIATLGTTSCCSYDNIKELGRVCQREQIWLHVDAAYAGSAFICPEYRPILNGIELADSYNFNPHKWMLVNFDCSAMWVKDRGVIEGAFNVDPLYLKHEHQGGPIPDYRHWHIPLGRRFRSLKLWFVMRLYGQKALREYIRGHVKLAHDFEDLVSADDRFEITNPVTLGLVCFRLRGPNKWSEVLNSRVNERGKIHMTPSKIRSTYILRLAICAQQTRLDDVQYAWNEISEVATEVLKEFQNCPRTDH